MRARVEKVDVLGWNKSLTRYPGWQEIHTTTYLDFLVLSFKILNNIEKYIYAITTKPNYPRDKNSLYVFIKEPTFRALKLIKTHI